MSEFMQEVMEYEPREGVDFIYHYYDILGVAADVEADELNRALRERASEYHPDRLAKSARELQTRGEHMSRLISQARIILTDEEKRHAYDDILGEWESWDGPISHDGTPILVVGAAMRTVMARHSSEEIEGFFADSYEQAVRAVKHNARRQAMHAKLLTAAEASGSEDVGDLREALDEDLLAEEAALAHTAEERGRLLGLPVEAQPRVAFGHAQGVLAAIEGARTEIVEEQKRLVLGTVSTKLALLVGDEAVEDTGEPGTDAAIVSDLLPIFFDDQAKRLTEIAKRREEILHARLDLFEPTYPLPEVQTELKPDFAIGIIVPLDDGKGEHYTWMTFSFDLAQGQINNVEMPEAIEAMLERKDYEGVYLSGRNVLTFQVMDHIDTHTLLSEACRKHAMKFYPGEDSDQLPLF